MNPACPHTNVAPEVLDQTLGIRCLDCHRVIARCWAERHIPESLWNRACPNDPEAIPCRQSREDVCALCNEKIEEDDGQDNGTPEGDESSGSA